MIAPKQLDRALQQLSAQSYPGYSQVTLPIEQTQPLDWLAQQEFAIRGYWHNKSGETTAYVGAADQLIGFDAFNKACAQLSSGDDKFRLYGGVAFSQAAAQWPGFPDYRFILPRFELRKCGDQCLLVINANIGETDPEAELAQIRHDYSALNACCPLPPLHCHPTTRQDTPEFDSWRKLVEEVVSPAFQYHTEKVVLARRTRIDFVGDLNPFSLLKQWQQQEPDNFGFLFQFDGLRTFLGCSPERLFHRSGTELLTEALAGTAPRGRTPAEDDAFADALLGDNKNQFENQLVLDDLICRLQALSRSVEPQAELELVKLDRIQHLRRTIRASINPALRDPQLLTDLHPTPAVGGTPRASALHYIQRHEGFNRGWYSGAVGCVSGVRSEFSVAIRSAMIRSNHIDTFAGAGIVQGSDPLAEWQELNNKIATVMSLIDDENRLS